MKPILLSILVVLWLPSYCQSGSKDADLKAFAKLRTDLGLAFKNGDIQTVTSYFHPDVVKALAYNKFLVGRDANIADIKGTFQAYSLSFVENKIESFEIFGNTATEISSFTIEGTPRGDGKPFTFKGRTMVEYIRYKESPAGWAIIRELIQTP